MSRSGGLSHPYTSTDTRCAICSARSFGRRVCAACARQDRTPTLCVCDGGPHPDRSPHQCGRCGRPHWTQLTVDDETRARARKMTDAYRNRSRVSK